MPVLGQADFLPIALSSIQAQTCPYQLAIMDATPDNTVQDVLKKYGGMLSYHRHGPDAGQSAAIQEGWDHTDGDIVAWLCADDYYFPYTFEEVGKIFVSHPEVDVVYGDSVFVDRDGNFLGYFVQIDDPSISILQNCCISQPSCFVRRSSLNRIGKLDAGLHYIMDWDLWTRLYKAGAKFHYLNKPLSVVRRYSATKTYSRSKERYAEVNRHLKCNVRFFNRLRLLLEFYHYDLLIGKKSFKDIIIFHSLDLLRLIKNFQWKYSQKGDKILYGFGLYSNKICGECQIFLPVYGDCTPRQVAVKFRGADTIQVYINGYLQDVTSKSVSKDDCSYVIEVSDNLIGNLLKLNLRSHSAKPWQLVSLNIS